MMVKISIESSTVHINHIPFHSQMVSDEQGQRLLLKTVASDGGNLILRPLQHLQQQPQPQQQQPHQQQQQQQVSQQHHQQQKQQNISMDSLSSRLQSNTNHTVRLAPISSLRNPLPPGASSIQILTSDQAQDVNQVRKSYTWIELYFLTYLMCVLCVLSITGLRSRYRRFFL